MKPLAPLQLIMLRDSLAGGEPGAHVEQVEIVFTEALGGELLAAAWAMTVAATEVLQTAFVIDGKEPLGWEKAEHVAALQFHEAAPLLLENWRVTDRVRPLLAPGTAPWRAVYWPGDRRFIWTFHHALLDGRSITRILRGFFQCLHDGIAPAPSAVTTWTPPNDRMKALAERIFQQEFAGLKPAANFPDPCVSSKTIRYLGKEAADLLGSVAEAMHVSPATLLTWCWGQAVMKASGEDAAIVEQLRCGPPQEGRTGFTMNTLPLAIHRATADTLERQLQKFRARLLAMREIESIAPYDLPAGVIELTNDPWSSVIMIEHGTPEHMAGGGNRVESVTLHEWPGGSLTAVAYHLPDLRLEVEGPRNAKLLALWAGLIRGL
ncbi:MAG: hypothetical protein ABIT37_17805 [Luteolibacter sp.]